MIQKGFYKDRPAFIVKGKELEAKILPEDGAKLASLKTGSGRQLLEEAPGEAYRRLTLAGSYVEAECSAFDDMFPTIDPCETAGFVYPDHGDVCRVRHRAFVRDGKLFTSAVSPSVNALFEKEFSADDGGLVVCYRIENQNDASLPCLWAGHMMFAAREGAEVVTDYREDEFVRVMFGAPPGDGRLGRIGPFRADGESYKYYYKTSKAPMRCGIRYPDGGLLTVSFEGDFVRWLGVWMNNGSFKEMYNIALEPCAAPYDSPVNAGGEGAILPPHGSASFVMRISWEEGGEESGRAGSGTWQKK